MLTIIGLGLRVIIGQWRTALMLALTVALSLASFLVLRSYHSGLVTQFAHLSDTFLVVQQTGTMGELIDSRLPAALDGQLAAAGASRRIPEIHTVTGSTPENSVMLRGIVLDQYMQTEPFKLVAGRPLLPGNPARQAMIGSALAKERGVQPGGIIQIRGRDFEVVGVFQTDTYAEYEAWVSLADAQALLGWGSDVSIFLIPAGEKIKDGDEISVDASVVKKGEAGMNLVNEWQPLFDLLEVIAWSLGAATAVALANILWRLAWLRRRDLAILQSIGFGRPALSAYLLAQGVGISLAGYVIGVAAAVGIGQLTKIQTSGVMTRALFDFSVLGWSFLFACLIALAGCALPVWWLSRMNLAVLLRVED
jgi:putative ABC transport system permease protein